MSRSIAAKPAPTAAKGKQKPVTDDRKVTPQKKTCDLREGTWTRFMVETALGSKVAAENLRSAGNKLK